jgi:hypothetical protein
VLHEPAFHQLDLAEKALPGGEVMVYQNAKQWITALDHAVLEILAQNTEPGCEAEYSLRSEGCRQHGSSCVRVVFGELLIHVPWKESDPSQTAATLLETMLPDFHSSKHLSE